MFDWAVKCTGAFAVDNGKMRMPSVALKHSIVLQQFSFYLCFVLFCLVRFGSGFTLSEERNCGGVRVTSPLDWCMSLKPHHSFSSVPFQVLSSIGHSILHVHIRSSKWQNFETNAPSIVCNLKLFLRSASISFITSVNIWFLFLSPWRWEMPTVQLRQPTLMLRNDWCSIFVI